MSLLTKRPDIPMHWREKPDLPNHAYVGCGCTARSVYLKLWTCCISPAMSHIWLCLLYREPLLCTGRDYFSFFLPIVHKHIYDDTTEYFQHCWSERRRTAVQPPPPPAISKYGSFFCFCAVFITLCLEEVLQIEAIDFCFPLRRFHVTLGCLCFPKMKCSSMGD